MASLYQGFSIRTQLLLLVLAAALPASLMLTYEVTHGARLAQERAQGNVLTMARNIADDLDLALRDKESLLQKLAAKPLTDPVRCSRILAEYVELYEGFISLSVRDLQGAPICSSRPDPEPYPLSVRQAWFDAAARAPGFFVSEPFFGPRSGNWATVLTYPIAAADGATRALLVLPIELASWQRRVFRNNPPQASISVMSGRGAFLMHSDEASRLIGKHAPGGGLRHALGKEAGTFTADDRAGVSRVFGFSRVDGRDWYAFVSLPEELVYAEHRAHLRRSVVFGVVVLGTSLLLAWRLAKAIGRPIAALANAAERAVRDPQARARLEGPAEVRQVARQFNDLLDVRDRHAGELLEANSRYAAMIDASGLVMYEWDPDRDVTNYGGKVQRVLGYTIAEMAGGLDRRIALIHPDDAPAFERAVRHAAQTGDRFAQTYRVFRKDGACLTVEDCGEFMHDASGRRTRMVGFITDITERERARGEIVQLNATLEQRVAERTAQLDRSNRELNAFSYAVSHDLRAPLRGIDGWSLALLEDCADQLDERGREYLQRVRSETQRMGQLIDDLLLLSRTSQSEMHTTDIDLSAMAAEIGAKLAGAEPQRQVALEVAPGLHARGDAGLLRIALTNLLANAWKFTGKTAEPRIVVGSESVDGRLAYFVRDNGVGFDMRYAGKLFAPFQRMHRASDFPGSGIGLATVQRIVLRHGGRIWAESQPDQGAAFYFTLERPDEK
jgi:PAS domain S-box-containing protein